MKKLLGILLIVMTFSSTAQAVWQSVNAQVRVNNSSVRAKVSNVWGNAIVCRGYAYAESYYGYYANSYMNNVVIYPGRYAYVYVNANNPNQDPIVRGWANIECAWY